MYPPREVGGIEVHKEGDLKDLDDITVTMQELIVEDIKDPMSRIVQRVIIYESVAVNCLKE